MGYTKKAPKKKAPSGKHKKPRRLMTAELEQFVEMDDVATADGLTWNAWALSVLLAKVRHVKAKMGETAGRSR